MRPRRLERNLRLLCGFRALQMMMLPIAIVPLYWRDDLGLSMTEIFLIHALFGLFAAILEFPGGYLADRIGYRAALRVATGCSAIGWIVLGSADGIVVILLGELLLACSLSLSSGTDAAILYESLLELDRESEFGRWFGLSRSLGAAAEGTAALAAGLLYSIWPPLPFFLQAGLWGFNALIAFALIEPVRHHVGEIAGRARVRAIFHFAAVRSPRLRASIAAVLALALATFIPVWIIAIYAENAGIAVAWIGPLWAAANYTVAFGHWASDRVAETLGTTPTLLLSAGLIGLGLAGLGSSHAVGGFLFYYAICLARGLNSPVLSHVQQRVIPSSDRASLLSINSLLFRATFFLLGPLIGLGMDRLGEHVVLWVSGLIMTPISVGSVLWLARTSEPEGDAATTLHDSDL
ncbi:MAG: MFS transporter [Deltaproteobacteria bacterium]|nr:MFS transporter [Deltaproteobacteria bacterium]